MRKKIKVFFGELSSPTPYDGMCKITRSCAKDAEWKPPVKFEPYPHSAGMTRKVFRAQRTPRDIKSDPKIAARIRTVKKVLNKFFLRKTTWKRLLFAVPIVKAHSEY